MTFEPNPPALNAAHGSEAVLEQSLHEDIVASLDAMWCIRTKCYTETWFGKT